MRKAEEVKIPGDLTTFEDRYSVIEQLQKSLINEYVQKKGQINYPIDLNDRGNQTFMRELFGFLEEELAESFEVLDELTRNHETLKPKEKLKLLQEYNLEQADCLHFFVEVLLYSNIQEPDLKEYYRLLFESLNMESLNDVDVLTSAMNYAGVVDVMAPTRYRASFKVTDHAGDLYSGGTKVGFLSLEHSEKALFKVFYYLRLASNTLKNKYWKETETGVNMEAFHDHIMEAWLHYTLYLKINGFNPADMLVTYYRKNEVNLIRIKEKY